ncbi:hypothetical protein [Adlercreutzia sp. ZJ154]|uniref:hypothetical protein n=1 Tax=Adlercreutzia sp. ZJ154 TaxID=2709790 RepID=UPI0013EBB594|nr:hypothetical protein [Adlercreutzia sp. ZJ154]
MNEETPQAMLQRVLNAEMSDETCERFYLSPHSTWMKALCMSMFEKAFQGDSDAFRAILETAYPEGIASVQDDEYEDALSRSLRQMVENL